MLLLFILFGVFVNGEVRLSGLFGDHMVIQVQHPELGIHPSYIYGLALLNETVTIIGSDGFPGPFKLTPTTNNSTQKYGNWSTSLIADTNHPTYPGPFTINITSTNINNKQTGNIIIQDIYFGELILCTGQSNMGTTVAEGDSKEQEIAIAKNFPNIRLLHINNSNSDTPMQNTTGIYNNTWMIAGTKTPVGSDSVGTFSAACWMTGRRITAYLETISSNTSKPYVGLIESSIGGTTVHFWAPAYVGIACNSSGQLPNTGECASGPAGQLFNTMINPISFGGKGLSVRNILYYQGEADSGENDLMTQQAYECELFGLINAWRNEFNISNLVFINFQLPGHFGTPEYENDDKGFCCWSAIQVAQYNVFKLVNNTGLVTAQDQGQNTLHYKHKTVVSERAANWSIYLSWNNLNINPEGPKYKTVYKTYGNQLSVIIELSNIINGIE
eukprot:114602_1